MKVPIFWNIKLRRIIIFIIFGASLLLPSNRDCPDNFITNPQYPASEPECFPDEFVFYSSTSIAYYYFLSATINDFPISGDDWVGAYSCNQWENDICVDLGPCVGSRKWGECNLGTGCDVPVFGDDGSDFTDNYLLTNEIPVFKIYDFSNNIYTIASPSENIPWQYLSNPSLEQLSTSYDILGCTDNYGINFDPYANVDDGSCIVETIPEGFEFNQSTNQAFYFFQDVTIDNITLTENDWVGAFNGNICIGARRWNVLECNDQVCDIPIMGDDGEEYSTGYIQNGEFPTFKIFDYSQNNYYDAMPSSSEPWQNFGLVFIDNLYAFSVILGCTDLNACNYNPSATNDDGSCEYPENNYDCDGDCIVDIDCAGECGGTAELDDDGSCIQECDSQLYLDEFNYHDFEFNGSISASVLIDSEQNGSINDILAGYVNNEIRGFVQGDIFPITGEIIFSLMLYSNQASGENLSFKYFHAASNQTFCLDETLDFTSDMIIGNALDPFIFNIQEEYNLGCTDTNACNYDIDADFDDGTCEYPNQYYDCNDNCLNDSDEDNVCDEIDLCEGNSNLDTDNDGICNENDPCIGYDNNNDEDLDGVCDDYDPCYGFSNIDSDGDGLCNDQEVEGCSDPEACNYNPDTTEEGNCIYEEEYYDCNDNCINDIDEDSVCDELELIGCTDNNACNYNPAATDEGDCEYAEEFYNCEGECIAEIDCEGTCGGGFFIDDCGECVEGDTPSDDCLNIQLPTEFSLSQNYPNPFNPITSIDYTIPNSGHIEIVLYDIRGNRVKTLLNKFHHPGYFKIKLSSSDLNSGVYIVKLISQQNIFTRKIAVVK